MPLLYSFFMPWVGAIQHRSSTKRVKLCSLINGCTHQNMKTSQKHFKNWAGFLRNKPSRNAFQSSQFLESAFGGGYGGNPDEFRLTTFKASSSNNLRELPPSRRGLELHVRRASYQAGAMLYPKSQHQNFLNLVGQLLMVSPIFFGQQMVQKRVLLMKSQKPASAKFHHQA